MKLRDYQEDCLAAHWRYFENASGNPLFVVPTGGGKSHIMASFIQRSIEAWPSTRFLVVTHVKELIEQNHDKFLSHIGGFGSVGIYSAGIGRRDVGDQVLFAGIQSIYQRARQLGPYDVVLVDECHLIPKKGHGRYRHYLEELRELNPDVRVCGYTATPYRLDGGWLHRGQGAIFDDIAFDLPIKLLVDRGFLAPVIAKRPRTGLIDTSKVGTSTGDFKKGELEDAAMDSDVVAAVNEAIEHGRDRKRWLIFACGIAHAEQVCEVLTAGGISNQMVIGSTPKAEREAIIDGFKMGSFRALVNVGVLTTGFDAVIDMLVVMRPTQSTGLYVQIYGRGMRIDGSSGMTIGKKDCLALDYGGNVERHGPINAVRPKQQSAGDESPPVKVCPECLAYVAAAARECEYCGHTFPEPEPLGGAHDREASTAQPLDFDEPDWLDVNAVFYRIHEKVGGPPSLRIDYICGMRTISHWVCLEHTGFARTKAVRWWLNNAGPGSVPESILDALERQSEIRVPAQIRVVAEGKYDRVAETRWRKP